MTHPPATPSFVLGFGYLSILFAGAIFGFFYAWICSTMWGLDAAAPNVAVSAMQAMNASVRNAVFAPGFFGPGPICALTAGLAWYWSRPKAAVLFAAAGVTYILGGNLLTFVALIPMNEALALENPQTQGEAAQIWQAYSGKWQMFNIKSVQIHPYCWLMMMSYF